MRLRRFVSYFLVFALCSVTPALAQQKTVDPAKALDGFDDFVNQTIKDWHGAGAAVAVVRGDKVILLKGYGYRDVEKKLPMTPKSLCAIASITKSFTVSDLGMLMDEGKGAWDVPVRTVFPSFKLYDPVLTEQMTVRDLVTHRSGLPRHDMVWYSSDFSRDDLIRRLQYLGPNKPLRTTFQYNNLMFMTAGYVAGLLDNKKWEDSLRARVLAPLGMTATTFSLKELQSSPDFALPYQKGHDLKAELKRMPFEATCPDTCALGPAGELNSNAEDMSHYLLFHLNKGAYNGRQLLSENNSSQMQTPQMAISGTPDYPELGGLLHLNLSRPQAHRTRRQSRWLQLHLHVSAQRKNRCRRPHESRRLSAARRHRLQRHRSASRRRPNHVEQAPSRFRNRWPPIRSRRQIERLRPSKERHSPLPRHQRIRR